MVIIPKIYWLIDFIVSFCYILLLLIFLFFLFRFLDLFQLLKIILYILLQILLFLCCHYLEKSELTFRSLLDWWRHQALITRFIRPIPPRSSPHIPPRLLPLNNTLIVFLTYLNHLKHLLTTSSAYLLWSCAPHPRTLLASISHCFLLKIKPLLSLHSVSLLAHHFEAGDFWRGEGWTAWVGQRLFWVLLIRELLESAETARIVTREGGWGRGRGVKLDYFGLEVIVQLIDLRSMDLFFCFWLILVGRSSRKFFVLIHFLNLKN